MRIWWLAIQAYEANQNLEITLEQPQDPEQWKQPPPDVKEKNLRLEWISKLLGMAGDGSDGQKVPTAKDQFPPGGHWNIKQANRLRS